MNDDGRTPELHVSRRLSTALGLLAVVLLVYQAWLSVGQWPVQAADVHAFRIAAQKVAEGSDPYRTDDGTTLLRYLYPPTFVLAFSPILRVPGTAGFVLWSAVQLGLLALLFVCLRVAARRLALNGSSMWLAATLLLFGPAWRNLVEGQISSLAVACLFGGALLVEARQHLAGGALLAAAAHVKVLPAAAFAVLIVQRRWRALLYGLACGILLVFAPLAWAWPSGGATGGPGVVLELWGSWIVNAVRPVALDSSSWVTSEYTPWNHSFVAALHRLFDTETAERFGPGGAVATLPRGLLRQVAWCLGGTGIALALGLARRGRHVPEVRIASYGLVLIMANLSHAQTWTHHLLALGLLLPLLAPREGTTWEAHPAAWYAVGMFGLLFSLPCALAVVLPAGWAGASYALAYEAGRYAIPTLAIVFVWASVFAMGWVRCRRESRGAGNGGPRGAK